MTTIVSPVLNALYNVNLTFQDHANERARKVSKLYNAGLAANIGYAMQAMADLSHAGIIAGSASESKVVDLEDDTAATQDGLYTLVGQRLVLGFSRVHPLNAAKIVTASFVIPAPINDIVTATNPKKPNMVRGVTFANSANRQEDLGALVDWLQTALTYEAVNGTTYVGGWTYSADRSGLVLVGGIIDGDIRT